MATLYDDISLGYHACGGSKVGKLYSFKPTDGSGDFAVTRAGTTAFTQTPSGYWKPAAANEPRFTYTNGVRGLLVEGAATRLNADPYSIEKPSWSKSGARVEGDPATAGSELITNAADREFASDTGFWTKETGMTIADGVCHFTNVADFSSLRRNGILVTGKYYIITYDVKNYVSGAVRIMFGSTIVGTSRSANGTYTEMIVSDSANFVFQTSLGPTTLDIDNVSIKEVSGFDCPFVDANGINTKQGRKLVEDTSNGNHYITNTPSLSITTGTIISVSAIAKYAGRHLYLYDNSANAVNASFNLQNGTLIAKAANVISTTIKEENDGYYKVTITYAVQNNLATLRPYTHNGSTTSYQGDGVSGVIVSGFFVEAGTAATSPIGGAEGATQTRNADVEVTDGVTSVTQMVVTDTNDNEVVIVVGSPNFTIPTGEIKHIVGTPDDVDVDYYGVEIDSTQSNPTITRIGNAGLHRSLPIQNNIYACVLADNGVEAYKLNPSNWAEKLTGGASKLDGTDGQVMIYLPAFWWKWEVVGTKNYLKISEFELPGFAYSKPEYLSAYKASLMRSTLKLSSVKNTTTDYRGGGNQSAWDALAQTQLGMPVTNLSRTNFRTYARNRGAGWEAYNYHAWWKMFILFTIEYATLNSQAAVNSALDANGFKQGGLGSGVTDVNSTKWTHLYGYYPLIPNGASDSLASATGEVTYTLPFEFDVLPPTFVNAYSAATAYTVGQYTSYNNLLYKCILNSTGNLPTNTTYWVQTNLYKGVYDAGTTYQPDDYVSSGALLYRCILESTGNAVTNTTYFVAVTRSTTKVNRYRGIEMPFGHIWDWCEGVNIRAAANSDADPTHKAYVCEDPASWNDSNYTNYTLIGELPRANGYIKQMIPGHFLPLVAGGTGAGSAAYWCDYFYQSIPASGVALRGLLLGGAAVDGANAGLGSSLTSDVPATARASFGSRLCYKPSI